MILAGPTTSHLPLSVFQTAVLNFESLDFASSLHFQEACGCGGGEGGLIWTLEDVEKNNMGGTVLATGRRIVGCVWH